MRFSETGCSYWILLYLVGTTGVLLLSICSVAGRSARKSLSRASKRSSCNRLMDAIGAEEDEIKVKVTRLLDEQPGSSDANRRKRQRRGAKLPVPMNGLR